MDGARAVRISELAVLNDELTAWTGTTNADDRQVHSRFTTSAPALDVGICTQRFSGDSV